MSCKGKKYFLRTVLASYVAVVIRGRLFALLLVKKNNKHLKKQRL